MDGLFVVLVIIYVVYSFNKAAKVAKSKQQKAASVSRKAEAGQGAATGKKAGGGERRPAPKPRATVPVAAQATAATPGARPLGEGMSAMNHSLQTRMEPSWPSAPRKSDYVGSLGVSTAEGEDVCDPGLGHRDAHPYAPSDTVYEGEIGAGAAPQWNGQAIVRGVVMSEILKRPGERKWGKTAPWMN